MLMPWTDGGRLGVVDNLASRDDVTVRAERPEDHAAIDQVVEAAFGSSG